MDRPWRTNTELLQRIAKQLEVARTIPSTPLRLRERSVEAAVDYILENPRFADVQVSVHNIEALRAGLQATSLPGLVAEFGVYKGQTLTVIANHFAGRTVHGFDSFVGLPESWGGTNKTKGSFSIGGSPPKLPVGNVQFHVGFFNETVPIFAQQYGEQFSFVHIDSDIYSSAKLVLDELGKRFVPGTVIVFDEYFGYHGWQHHEHRAFMEFLQGTGLDYDAIAIGHMNLAVVLTEEND